MTTYAGGTGSLPVGMTPGEPRGRGAGFWVRTVLGAAVGIVAAGLLAVAGVLTVFALVVTSPEQPGRSIAALLSVPDLRRDAAESLVADVEESRGRDFAPATRTVLVEAADEALGDERVLDALASVPVVDGRLDPAAYVAAVAQELGAQAEATDDAEARRVLSTFARELPDVASADEGSGGDSLELVSGMGQLQRYGLVAAAVVGGLGLLALLVATAVAVRRGLTAALAVSTSLVMASLVLAPSEWLLDRGEGVGGALARVVATAGELAGPGLVWSLLLASVVPPALWWAVRSTRRTA
ncbi:hypothetical protein [Nocardioides sp. Soil805]|uniref:hypothetical protein n=1 Tax=Nocardioides sp. Soil805 TaxID=1736416 RepID=UPI000703A194|nr:hypothetical protein [Nocardioides sp. Soil805]